MVRVEPRPRPKQQTGEDKLCAICNGRFYVKKSRAAKAKTCSQSCAADYLRSGGT